MKSDIAQTTPLTEAAADMTRTQIEPMGETVARTLKHRRNFCYEVYEREDGLWDIEAQMQDRKSYPFPLASEPRAAAQALHNMILRVTVDAQLNIVAVQANTLVAPYLPQCANIIPDYQQMVGLNIMHGFRAALRAQFSGVLGCTHITELANTLPTVVVQGVGVELASRKRKAMGDAQAGMPFQLNQCHALIDTGEAVRLYYPRWYRAPSASDDSNE